MQLQGRRRGDHVSAIQLLAGAVPLGYGIPPLPQDPREPQDSDHQDRRRQASLVRPAPGPLADPSPDADWPSQDRPTRKETGQVIRQAFSR